MLCLSNTYDGKYRKIIVAKAEIAHYEQFLLLPQSFKKSRALYMHQKASASGKGFMKNLFYKPENQGN